jgi:hypothetical protein
MNCAQYSPSWGTELGTIRWPTRKRGEPKPKAPDRFRSDTLLLLPQLAALLHLRVEASGPTLNPDIPANGRRNFSGLFPYQLLSKRYLQPEPGLLESRCPPAALFRKLSKS